MTGDGWRDRATDGLSRLASASVFERFVLSVAALVTSVLVGGVIVLVSGWAASCSTPAFTVPGLGAFCWNPITVFYYLFQGAFGSSFNVAVTLQETTLLVFTGLSVAIAFRAGMFNIGAQGQMVLGALASALVVVAVAPFVPTGIVGAFVLVPLGLLAGAVVGGGYAAIPGALKAYADANEVITTIMLNFVATSAAFVLVSNVFGDPTSQSVETSPVPGYAALNPVLFSGSSFSLYALALGLVLVVAVYVLLFRTSFGYDLRTSGVQPEAAEYSGVNARWTMVSSMVLSGAVAGVGGTIYVLMVLQR